MHLVRTLSLATFLPLFAGCQLLAGMGSDTPPALSGQSRMQGTLSQNAGQWVFTPCDSPRTFVVDDQGNTGIAQEAAGLALDTSPLFADLKGRFDGNSVEGTAGTLNLQTLYRLERGTGACADPNFKVSGYVAQGPGWSLRSNAQGMKLEREGQPDLAVPYVQEQLPGGGTSLTSEVDHQRIEVWLAPQRCVEDSRVSFLSAELRVADKVQRGCGYPGGNQGD